MPKLKEDVTNTIEIKKSKFITYLHRCESEEDANSRFTIPIADLTQDVPVIADTLAMGTPHEVQYVLTLDPASIASKSTLPQEGAKRVLIMAAVIIIGGGILNHFVNERRKQDYTGKRR